MNGLKLGITNWKNTSYCLLYELKTARARHGVVDNLWKQRGEGSFELITKNKFSLLGSFSFEKGHCIITSANRWARNPRNHWDFQKVFRRLTDVHVHAISATVIDESKLGALTLRPAVFPECIGLRHGDRFTSRRLQLQLPLSPPRSDQLHAASAHAYSWASFIYMRFRSDYESVKTKCPKGTWRFFPHPWTGLYDFCQTVNAELPTVLLVRPRFVEAWPLITFTSRHGSLWRKQGVYSIRGRISVRQRWAVHITVERWPVLPCFDCNWCSLEFLLYRNLFEKR